MSQDRSQDPRGAWPRRDEAETVEAVEARLLFHVLTGEQFAVCVKR